MTGLGELNATHGVPLSRLRRVNGAKPRRGGRYVVYWMISTRRLADNYGLQYAAGEANARGCGLVILEAIRSGYRWASDRLHAFALDGMADHARALGRSTVVYHPYVEPQDGAGSGLLEALASEACLVVTDEFPCFFLPRMVEAAGRRLDVALVAADSNGLLPLSATNRAFGSAYQFRRFLQKNLAEHLEDGPLPDPLDGLRIEPVELPSLVVDRWPAERSILSGTPARALAHGVVGALSIDHSVEPVPFSGGPVEAGRTLDVFLADRLSEYGTKRNEPDEEATSGLSPYLHWGHISPHRVLRALAAHEEWNPADISNRVDGRREGWWGMSANAEAFLDQLVTWRELGYNTTTHMADYDRYESLPDWARATLADHRSDPRPYVYSHDQFEAAETHDELWNAAQRQLRREGRIHNYLRMLWGKKILEWSDTPESAIQTMIELNNRWSMDGRNPNSYSGIFWCLGRYDRPWPERPVFGKVRSMTSASTRRKHSVRRFLERFAE